MRKISRKIISIALVFVMVLGLGAVGVMAVALGTEMTVSGGFFRGTVVKNDGTVWSYIADWPYVLPPQQVNIDTDNVTAIDGFTALKNDGTVWAWTWCGATNTVTEPVQLQNLNNITAIANGLALRSDGTVWFWERFFWNFFNDGESRIHIPPEPKQVQNLSNVTAIANGASLANSTALRSDGTVWVWTWGSRYNTPNEPIQLQNLNNVTAITEGTALRSDGTLWSWAWVWYEEIDGVVTVTEPIQIQNLDNVLAIAGRVALRNDGTIWDGSGWQLRGLDAVRGLTIYDCSGTPLENVTAIADGVAVTQDGYVWLWNSPFDNRAERLASPTGVGYFNVGTGITTLPTITFTDVTPNAWYSEYVSTVNELGLMTGTGEGIFSPNGTVTHAQAITTLWRDAGEPGATTGGTWYTNAVAWARENGLPLTFRPADPISRESIAMMFEWYAEYAGIALTAVRDYDGFSDTDNTAVRTLYQAGIINGVGGGRFAPQGNTTRAQFAALLTRLLV